MEVDQQQQQATTLDGHIQSLEQTSEQLNQIANYCRTLYAQPDLPKEKYQASVDQVKSYANSALTTLSTQLTAAADCYLNSQSDLKQSICDIESELNLVSTKFAAVQENIGRQHIGYSHLRKLSNFKIEKIRRVDKVSYQVPQLFNASSNQVGLRKIDLTQLDGVGTALVPVQALKQQSTQRMKDQQSTTSFQSQGSSPSVVPPAPVLMSAPIAPPAPVMLAPSAPVMSAPPAPVTSAPPAPPAPAPSDLIKQPASEPTFANFSGPPASKSPFGGVITASPPNLLSDHGALVPPPAMMAPPMVMQSSAANNQLGNVPKLPPQFMPPPSMSTMPINRPPPPMALGGQFPTVPQPMSLPQGVRPPANFRAAGMPPMMKPPSVINAPPAAMPPVNIPVMRPPTNLPNALPPPAAIKLPATANMPAAAAPSFKPPPQQQFPPPAAAYHAPPPPPVQQAASYPLGQMKCLYPYTASAEGEMSISPGDVITVIGQDQGDGWTEGSIESQGLSGLFPTQYAKLM